MWALTAAAAMFALVSVGLATVSIQIDGIGKRADTLEARLTTVAESIAIGQAKFTTDFTTADEMRTSLEKSRSEIEAVRTEALAMSAPLLVPAARIEPLTRALVARADALAEYGDVLRESAEFAVQRAGAFGEIADALSGLSALSEKGVTVGDAGKVVRGVRADFEAALTRMRSESPTSPVLYSNVRVLPRLDELSVSLSEIEDAIAARDQGRIGRAFKSYLEVAGKDWVAYMALHDPEGRQAVNAAARIAWESAASPEGSIEALDSLGQTLILLALAAIVAAGLAAFGALQSRSAYT